MPQVNDGAAGQTKMDIVLIRRKPHLDRETFSKYYCQVHGPLATSLPIFGDGIYYEQWHNVDAEGSSDALVNALRAAPRNVPTANVDLFDAAAMLFSSDQADFDAGTVKDVSLDQRKPAFVRIARDEEQCIDMPQCVSLSCVARFEAGPLKDVHPRQLPSRVQKNVMIFAIARPEGWTREQWQNRWRDGHGPVVERVMGAFGAVKYLQMHNTSETPGAKRFRQDLLLEGVALMWIDPELRKSLDKEKARAAAAELMEDELKFIDFNRAYPMYTEPRWKMTDWPGKPNKSPMSEEEYERRRKSVLGPVPPLVAPPKL